MLPSYIESEWENKTTQCLEVLFLYAKDLKLLFLQFLIDEKDNLHWRFSTTVKLKYILDNDVPTLGH